MVDMSCWNKVVSLQSRQDCCVHFSVEKMIILFCLSFLSSVIQSIDVDRRHEEREVSNMERRSLDRIRPVLLQCYVKDQTPWVLFS